MTISPMLDTRRQRTDNTYPVIIRIRHGNKTREIGIGYKLPEKNWRNNQAVNHPDAGKINRKITDLLSEATTYYDQCQRTRKPFLIDLIGTGRDSYCFNDYLIHRADQFHRQEMLIMETKTRRMEKELRVCFGREIYFGQVNQDMLRDYEAWLTKQQNVNNTRHKKFKFLQQFYSQAVLEGKAQDPNPFKLYKIATKPVRKEKLTEKEIKAIEKLSLQGPVNDARNLFLFSYYAKGSRFENCVTFRREQVVKDRLLFRANKGNKYITVQIHPRLKKILAQYKGKSTFLFPFVKELPEDKKSYISLIGSLNVVVNRNLKTVAALAGTSPIAFHIARHSFAYHLKKIASSIGVISDSLGHSSSRTTEIYLKALDDEFLDKELKKLYGK